MENKILLQNVTINELVDMFNNSFNNQIKSIIKEIDKEKSNDILLTRKEVCEMFKINPSTLFHWVKKGKIKAYGISGRRYYKKAELINSLTLLNKK